MPLLQQIEMKFLVVASVFVLCFFGSTAGLQCYECKDMTPDTRCEETIIKTCEPGFTYCATLWKVEKSGETTVQKACVPENQSMCKIGETVKVGPNPAGVKGSLLCCEVNLCNSSIKLTNLNAPFYAIALSCVFSLVEFLFN